MRREDVLSQPPGVGIAHMVDPALHAGVQFGERDAPRAIPIQIGLQPPREIHDIASLQQAVRRGRRA